ncbi:type IV pilus assembly protein PilV [Rhodanobacter sp. ANJX3]|uniref:type IV pilus modification protein PilV n=1 Tax=Rhodanobacter sp. ANJX3 TaxID=2723083 RepID=UPI0017C806BA|nr:type IV pilus modification protein PilV [Rhodanobacter sp. ANJX3]MBB5360591.1 type IV pilus assembly protein PilV [Rhodanobacter sp. ANJX3]
MSSLIKNSICRYSNSTVVRAPDHAKLLLHIALRSRCPISLMARQSGVGLIEVLVAVLVLSIAFLGVAALQAVSLSTSNSAMARSMATISSYSILDAMRADSVNAKAGLYNTTTNGPVSTSSCPAAGSTLISVQTNQWCTQLGASLGVSTGTTYAVNCDSFGKCSVSIVFDDSRSGSGGAQAQTVSTVAYL